jgi:ADP-heptose:LPS heptosyltransferase
LSISSFFRGRTKVLRATRIMSPRSSLVLFPGALGDYLCVRPTLLRLRDDATGEITVVTRAPYFPLLAADGIEAISIERREVADLFAASPLRTETMQLLGGREEIHSWTGYGDANFAARLETLARHRARVHPFRALRDDEHASDYYARCAATRPLHQPLPIGEAARRWAEAHLATRRRVLVVHAGSGGRHKNWLGMEQVARRWHESGGAVVQLAGPSEADAPPLDFAAALCDASLDRVAALLRAADCYLGNDSGISHLAAAAGARGLALFGPTSARQWRPRGDDLRVLAAQRSCDSCAGAFCTHRLDVATVWQHLTAAQRSGERFS